MSEAGPNGSEFASIGRHLGLVIDGENAYFIDTSALVKAGRAACCQVSDATNWDVEVAHLDLPAPVP